MFRSTVLSVALLVALSGMAHAADVRILNDFETDADLRGWEIQKKTATLSDQHVTHGNKSLRVAVGEYMVNLSKQDWSGFDSLDADVFVDGDQPVTVTVLVGDQGWLDTNRNYWNRHNSTIMLRPGKNVMSIALGGMFRGEAGSRYNDIRTSIDLQQIRRFDLGFASGGEGAIYIDHLRLVNEAPPAGVLAFDFGPESQTVFPGFTPIGPNTLHGADGNPAGLRRAAPAGHARDSIFPTRLYQDFVGLDDEEFIVNVANGTYHVWVVFEDLGYWGGEQARYAKRVIEADGKPAVVEEPGAAGESDYLFRFESVEPRPGDDFWELYASHLFRPRTFQVAVTDGQLNLRFPSSGFLNSKVAAVIVYPDANAGAAEWVKQVERRNREEFASRAVFMGPQPRPLDPPAEALRKGWWLGFPSLEQDVSFADAPGPADGDLSRRAARDQRVSYTFALRPLRDAGDQPVSLTATDLSGPDGATVPAAQVDLRYVHHHASRGFNSIAYTIRPESLRPVEGANLKLVNDLTRQFWVTVHVPADANPGTYTGQLALRGGSIDATVPISVDVLDLTLDEPDFIMGFYGLWVPKEMPGGYEKNLREALTLLRQHGMNSFTGGPDVPFSGLDADGKPILDFAAADRFFRVCREVGFTRPVWSYGGPGMVAGLHGPYVVGDVGRAWAAKTGKSFEELLKIVWSAVDAHAKQQQWPPILYNLTDEPRVLATANEQLELMRMYRSAAPFVQIGGSYSVHWDKDDELNRAIQEIFKTLTWSALNLHDQTDLAKAREFGRDLYIYNQGRSRFSFGAYQFAEMSKGVRGRIQWHALALHGYQFFDLDGREPDTAMLNWGSQGIIPTIHLPRCREGADDLRYAVTLRNLAERHTGSAQADAALAWLDQISDSIPAGQRKRPDGFMDDEAFRSQCIDHIVAIQRATR